MKKLIFLIGVFLLSSCGTYQFATFQPIHYSRPNVIVEPPSWSNFWFYNRTYSPYYIPPRVIVVNPKPKSKVKGRRATTTSPNRGRSNQSRSTYRKRN